MTIAQHLAVDDIAIILACLEEVTITDAALRQRNVQRQFCKALKRKVPQHYLELVEAGKFTDRSEELMEKLP